jgi:hypothetical protein
MGRIGVEHSVEVYDGEAIRYTVSINAMLKGRVGDALGLSLATF